MTDTPKKISLPVKVLAVSVAVALKVAQELATVAILTVVGFAFGAAVDFALPGVLLFSAAKLGATVAFATQIYKGAK